jgi:hypothetical protein
MEGNVKKLVAKTALTAAIVVSPRVGMGVGTAGASPVYGGALAIAFPWWNNAQWVNLQVASAFGPSNLYNKVEAESMRGCEGCNALAVNVQVDLVSYTTTPPNETDVANAIDRGGSNDQNLAAAAMFVVTSPGRLSLSGSGRAQLGSIEWQLRSLSLSGSTTAAVQGNIDALLGQVVQILQSDVTTSSATSTNPGGPGGAPVSPGGSTTSTSGVQITSNVQYDS